jgi:phosphoglycerate-specific signal transduction histidine kinase
MSPREQKLLIFFATAGFLVLNFLAIGFYKTKRLQVERGLDQASQKLETARMYQASREQVADQMEWLAKHEPQPAANQDVQTKLQQLCESEAKSAGLTIKSQKPLPTDSAEGRHYHRAKIQITVSGKEDALYRWFDRLNMPEQFRAATVIRLSPNTQDDTLIDCAATIEQWFVPLPPA